MTEYLGKKNWRYYLHNGCNKTQIAKLFLYAWIDLIICAVYNDDAKICIQYQEHIKELRGTVEINNILGEIKKKINK
jgi:hypothetical protein